MPLLFLDFETWNGFHDVRKVGSRKYSEYAEIMMAGYAVDSGPIKVWVDPTNGEFENADGDIDELHHYLADPNYQIWAHNAKFEQDIIEHSIGWPKPDPKRYWCTAALASSLALPRSLDNAARAINCKTLKDNKGIYHIRRYCVPCRKTINHPTTRWFGYEEPDRYMEFIEYCRTDVNVERQIYLKLKAFIGGQNERDIFLLDNKINNRGIPIDVNLAEKCLSLLNEYNEREIKRFRDLTGFNPSQRDRVLEWLEQQGVDMPDMQSATVEAFLEDETLTPLARMVLKIHHTLSKSSTKKLVPMTNAVCRDGRIHNALLYWGAERTGRWAGRIIQPQNFPRPQIRGTEQVLEDLKNLPLDELEFIYDDVPTAISACLRHLICAPKGREFVVADYASIEARGVCWLSGQSDALELFYQGADIYIDMAAHVFGVAKDRVNVEQRWIGKQVVLGAGYGLGVKGFQLYCAKMGVDVDDKLAEAAIYGYRDKYYKVVEFWKSLEVAAKSALIRQEVTEVGPYIKFAKVGSFLLMQLPSGRCLSHPFPKIVDHVVKYEGREWNARSIEFKGRTRDGKQWDKVRTYGGSLAESATQGVARDFMANGMLNAEHNGYEVIMTVHDEIVTEVPEGYGDIEEFENLICETPKWGYGMPLKAEGYRSKRYRK